MKNITVNIIRLLLFVLFVYAGISKLADYTEFTFQLGRSPYIQHFAGITAWALPLGELVIAWMLVFNRSVLPGLYASFFLMALFTGYIYAMLCCTTLTLYPVVVVAF